MLQKLRFIEENELSLSPNMEDDLDEAESNAISIEIEYQFEYNQGRLECIGEDVYVDGELFNHHKETYPFPLYDPNDDYEPVQLTIYLHSKLKQAINNASTHEGWEYTDDSDYEPEINEDR